MCAGGEVHSPYSYTQAGRIARMFMHACMHASLFARTDTRFCVNYEGTCVRAACTCICRLFLVRCMRMCASVSLRACLFVFRCAPIACVHLNLPACLVACLHTDMAHYRPMVHRCVYLRRHWQIDMCRGVRWVTTAPPFALLAQPCPTSNSMLC